MNEGRVMQEGTPYDIYHHPQNLFVAEFIGDPRINLMTGKLVRENGAIRLDCGDLVLPVDSSLGSKSGELIASIRPESIKFSTRQKDNWLRVRLDNVQPTGANTILQVLVGSSPITLLQPGFITLDVGVPLWIDFEPETLNFFDPDSKTNLSVA
jgi:multiple sugar transport system ATP-binding protein